MRRYTQGLSLLAAILIGCLTAGCGSAVHSAIASLSPSRSVSISSSPSASPSPSPITSTVTSTPSPIVSTSFSQSTTTVTAPPPTQSAAASALPSSSPAASGESGTNLIWLWVLLAVLAVVGLVVWIARSSGRRSKAAAAWQSRVIDAYAKGSALYDAISVAETPAGLAADDAGARWYDIQRRADDLAQTLYTLREAAPDEERRARVADALTSLQAVRSAMDAERAPGGAGPLHADVVRDRMYAFETALRALRSADESMS